MSKLGILEKAIVNIKSVMLAYATDGRTDE